MGTLRVCLVLWCVLLVPEARANHPVLVEGNNGADGGFGTNVVPAGAAGDWDGDGRVGTAEDTDNAVDRVFGTLTAALLVTNGGVAANGLVTIVTSGRFPEAIRLPNTAAGQTEIGGVTIIEAAPGVEAEIDAVIAGDLIGSTARSAAPGIIVDTQATDRVVVLRNLVIRNFSVGLEVRGNARVIVEHCRFDSNLEANVHVRDNARLTMTDTSVRAGGMRLTLLSPTTPAPGDGVAFEGTASGSLSQCAVAGNVAAGIRNAGTGTVRALLCNLFDNGADLLGTVDVQPSCPPPVCQAPVVTTGVGPCKRCKTKKGVTKCTKCSIDVQS